MRSTSAGSVGVSVIKPPLSEISTLRCPVDPMTLATGCESSRNLPTAFSTSPSRVIRTSTLLPLIARPVNWMRFCRRMRSTSSLIACSLSFRTAFTSTSRKRLEPPCRSSPSTMWRRAQDGPWRSVFSEKKFGTAKRHTIAAVSRIAATFHREKNNIDAIILVRVAPRRQAVCRSARALVLHRLALGAHFGDHRAHLAHAHAVGDLHFDLVVVDDLGDLADKPTVGHNGIAAPQRFDHGLMLLHPLLLRAQDQEIHDHDDQDQRQRRRDHAPAIAAEQRALGVCGRDQH